VHPQRQGDSTANKLKNIPSKKLNSARRRIGDAVRTQGGLRLGYFAQIISLADISYDPLIFAIAPRPNF
jgi:hypothetical protein